jgi:glycerophosphoryl diester phosphodiesterase
MAAMALGCWGTLAPAGHGRPAIELVERGGVPPRFDIQAHRGGLGLVTENTLEGFATALGVGVTTLELDVRLTEDNQPVVTHDRRVSPMRCRDTAPVAARDPEYPYVGQLIRTLSVAQLATLDCGWRRPRGFPHQRVVANARIPLLREVFALVDCYGADDVRFAVDIKFPADAPEESASRGQVVRHVARAVRSAHVLERVAIVSMDWGVLMRMRKVEPRLSIVAATHPRFLQAGEVGASPWLGGIDIDDFHHSVVAAAASFGADAIAPVHGTPVRAGKRDEGYSAFTTRALVRRAHLAGLTVIPWTVDQRATMRSLVAAGVDGIITNYPDRLRGVLTHRGLFLPAQMPASANGGACPGCAPRRCRAIRP